MILLLHISYLLLVQSHMTVCDITYANTFWIKEYFNAFCDYFLYIWMAVVHMMELWVLCTCMGRVYAECNVIFACYFSITILVFKPYFIKISNSHLFIIWMLSMYEMCAVFFFYPMNCFTSSQLSFHLINTVVFFKISVTTLSRWWNFMRILEKFAL